MERTTQPGTQRAADPDGNGRVAEDGTESLSGKNVRRERGKNHRARAKANAKKDHVNIQEPGLAWITEDHQSTDTYNGHYDIERVRRLFGKKIRDEAENHPAKATRDAGKPKI